MFQRHQSLQHELVESTAAELNLLPPSALQVLKVLLREKDRSAKRDGWVNLAMAEIARRARLSYEGARKGWAFIRRIGIGVAERHVIKRRVRKSKAELELLGDDQYSKVVNAYDENWYNVFGSIARRGHELVMCLELKAWRAFTKVAPQTNRSELPRSFAEAPAWDVSFEESQKDSIRLDMDSGRSSSLIPISSVLNTESSIAASRDFDAEIDLRGDDPEGPQATDALMMELLAYRGPRPTFIRKPGPVPHMPVDPALPVEGLTHNIIDVGVSEAQRAAFVVEGYRRAIREVYGERWYGWTKGDITKAKRYPQIKACADAMLDEGGMIPLHWALWRLAWFKANVKQYATKAPPMGVIMSAKSVAKMAGYFRKDYERPVIVSRMDYVREEQMLRNREAVRRHEGREELATIFLGMPQWYTRIRRAEILFGDDDPHARWPSRSRS